jgi:hypothetical protein
MDAKFTPAQAHQTRRIAGRAQQPQYEDPYRLGAKLPEPAACRQCGAVYHKGRWQWAARPADAEDVLCPACRRINDRLPAGILTLRGEYLRSQPRQVAIESQIRHIVEAEKAEHPLNRLMAIERQGDEIVVTTTDVHLPRRIGEAIHTAHHGDLHIDFEQDNAFVRVDWRRDR